MSASTKTWLNNNAPSCEDDDLNGFAAENNNLILGSGQALSTSDNQQTHKAVSDYAASGAFYTDAGIADAYALAVIGAHVSPPAYADGMIAEFFAGNNNTGASTVNVAGLGIKNIANTSAADVIVAGARYVLRYRLSTDDFEIFISGMPVKATPEVIAAGQDWNGVAYVDPDAIGASPTAKIYPDGTVVGSTVNGDYVKFPNGDLICTSVGISDTANAALGIGGVFRGATNVLIFPVQFTASPSASPTMNDTNTYYWGQIFSPTNSQLGTALFSAVTGVVGKIGYIAKGSWK